jgi:surface protein
MFQEARVFNGDIHAWDVSKVTDMKWNFFDDHAFTGNIHAWDVSKVRGECRI